MLIDWFTVVAQIVNFLILVALLKRFLYGRILRAMDERERKIASRFEEAEKERMEARNEAASHREKNRELDEKKEEFLSQARQEAESERKALIQVARQEADQVQARWQEALRQERESFLQELGHRVNDQVGQIARRAIKDLADGNLEKQVVDIFVKQLKTLDETKKKAIAESIEKTGRKILITSAFETSPEDRQRITETVRNCIVTGGEVDYLTSPGMILGIELKSEGYKIAWSLGEYLASLETEMEQALGQEIDRVSRTEREEKTPGLEKQ